MRSQLRQAPLFLLGCLLALTLLVAGCGAAGNATATTAAPTEAIAGGALATSTVPTAPDTTGSAATTDTYPAPATSAESLSAYPSEGEAAVPAESYPAPAAEETFLEPRFRIDQPVTAATTTITGQAPPNLVLAVLDVTYGGAPLGQGRSDENGVFSVPVSGLIAGNRIGLAIGELPQGLDIAQTAETYFPYRGEGFQNLPNIGVFYDTVVVQP
ncbi:MAG: hypothetical protein K1X50_07640 [Candidatus Promineofilum sp.]|mgnify:CR=1 FL=1|nr:hypothetical protein [Promineifilum sp.]MCW5863207.1 hypothetical protein [Anaerolineae bacterium]